VENSNKPQVQVVFAQPAAITYPYRASNRWLDVARLRDEIRRLTIRQCLDKRARTNLQRIAPLSDEADTARLAYEYNAEQLTLLCAIRALHRGRKHVIRQRVFGPGYPNGTAVVNRPVRIPSALLERYRIPVTR
jgi:hypothetical protein